MTNSKSIDAIFDAAVRELERARSAPRVTYRLQFNQSFRFRDARRLIPYLAQLGVSHVYASPYLKARPESPHGYDICDHNALNPSIGTEADYGAFVDALHQHGMGQIFDCVPNHMGIGESANAWWLDVLENGPSSPYARFFDIDWRPRKQELRGKVLLPILGDYYGVVLENQELQLHYAEGVFDVFYYEARLPIAPPTYPQILRRCVDDLAEILDADHPHLLELQSIITALEHLPPQDEQDPGLAPQVQGERQREQLIAKRRLATLSAASPEVSAAIEGQIEAFNGRQGDPESFDLLHQLLNAQSYRLAFWRVAAEEINYRRFFDINDLAAIRQEVPEVFEATHRLILRLLGEGKINGLRIDHPDGLWDPAGYFLQLQRSYFLELCRRQLDPDSCGESDWEEHLRPQLVERYDRACANAANEMLIRPLYLLAEKILEHDEELPPDWVIHGTTGYDFCNAVNGLFVDASNRSFFDNLYARFLGQRLNYADLVYQQKKLIMQVALASELNVLADRLNRISEQNRRSRDLTLHSLRDALREVIACFPVYRTYTVCNEDEMEVTKRDREYIETALRRAKRRNPALDVSTFDFVRDVLLLRYAADATPQQRVEMCQFVMKFQQTTGPIMAKGLEDTAFYIYNRLASLNEVGGDPSQFGISLTAFHRQNGARRKQWPHAMLCSSTHDTKRSEDVRARINVLSELPREWRAATNRWSRSNRRKKISVDGQPAPDRNEEYLLYQTLLGAWPLYDMDGATYQVFVERMQGYMLKALKEAKVNTSWINPNTGYDEAVQQFVAAILDASEPNLFLEDFAGLREKVAYYGMFNALSQTLLKLTAPGAPDIYQGNELWDFSLVDPDNRRPVDFQQRTAYLRDLQKREKNDRSALLQDLLVFWRDGRIKLYLTYKTLAFRREHEELFLHGDYIAVRSTGKWRDRLCAFTRHHDNTWTLVVAPRLLTGVVHMDEWPLGSAVWGEAALTLSKATPERWRNVLTGETVEVAYVGGRKLLYSRDLLQQFPAALLQGRSE